jgi:hypothetical protein
MDDADRASDLEEMQRQEALRRRKPVRKRDGYCLNCGERSEGAYCNKECGEDAERIERADARNGRKAEEEIEDSEL